jgi:FAD synthase
MYSFIRSEKKFESLDALKTQLALDAESAKKALHTIS